MTFSSLGLQAPIVKALDELQYQSPTPIQQQAIPAILQGEDILAAAQTGTGKTAAFALPLIQRFSDDKPRRPKRIRALILTPTRELAEQLAVNIEAYAKYSEVSSFAAFGGVSDEPQKQALIEGVDILVATPGRLLDLLYQRAVMFDALTVLVLDEADRMLDMGFSEDLAKIVSRLPNERQSLLFSATLSDDIYFLAKAAINAKPLEISVVADLASKPKIKQLAINVDKDKKSALLSHLIVEKQWQQALIFIRTKAGAAKLVEQLAKRGIHAEAFHSGRSQASRKEVLEQFKQAKLGFLVATGIASRGIDIEGMARVVNYDLPDEPAPEPPKIDDFWGKK